MSSPFAGSFEETVGESESEKRAREEQARKKSNGVDAQPPIESDIPADTMKIIREGAPSNLRVNPFWNVVLVLHRLGYTNDAALALLEKYADGVGKDYVGRLRNEVERIYARLDQRPQKGGQLTTTPPPDRANLLLSNWLTLALPPRDYLLGHVLCTTSRWILIGDTGIGKTLLGMAIAGAVASGCGLLGWQGSGRPRRVMYLDGEMPAETFKERMECIAAPFGGDLQFWGYNRDRLADGEMPPLNTPEGEEWLLKEIDAIEPDLIEFDSIMSLTIGPMSDEESWARTNLLMRKITSMRIGQIWQHHTGHDTTKGFGTKTREWQADTVAILLAEGGDAIRLQFNKARLRTPQTFAQFEPKLIRCDANGWEVVGDAPKGGKGKPMSLHAILKTQLLRIYDRLADAVETSGGFAGEPVRKVKTDAVREEMRRSGILDVDQKGCVTGATRMAFLRAKGELITQNKMAEKDGLIWRIAPARGEWS
jgi:hypothetical protein